MNKDNNIQKTPLNQFLLTAVISIVGTYMMFKLNEPTPYIQQPYTDTPNNIYQVKDDSQYYPNVESEKPNQSRKYIRYEIPDRDLNPSYRLDNYIRDYLEANPDIIEDYLDDY